MVDFDRFSRRGILAAPVPKENPTSEKSAENNPACRGAARKRIGSSGADFSRSFYWGTTAATSGLRRATSGPGARVRMGRGLLVPGRPSLQMA